MDARTAGRRMVELLGLGNAPVAVSFLAAAPAGVPRVGKAGPGGCAYWKQAADGAVFYTEAAACAMIPATLSGPGGVTSLGCIGNRVYTELGDDELYFTIPGAKVAQVVEQLEVVLHANRALQRYHEGRRASL